MEFKLNQRQIEIKKRECFISIVFISLILVIGAVGIIGPSPGIGRIASATAFIVLFGFLIRYILKDFDKTKQKMLAHKLVIDNHSLIIQHDQAKKDFDLRNIYSVRFRHRKGSVKSIVLNVRKNFGFKIKGYERMNELMGLLKESVPSSKSEQ